MAPITIQPAFLLPSVGDIKPLVEGRSWARLIKLNRDRRRRGRPTAFYNLIWREFGSGKLNSSMSPSVPSYFPLYLCIRPTYFHPLPLMSVRVYIYILFVYQSNHLLSPFQLSGGLRVPVEVRFRKRKSLKYV